MGPVPCGLTFMSRMRTVRLDEPAMETRDVKNYYDAEAIDDLIGPDAEGRMLEETDGLGYVRQGDDGDWYHRDFKTKEIEKMDSKKIDSILAVENEVAG